MGHAIEEESTHQCTPLTQPAHAHLPKQQRAQPTRICSSNNCRTRARAGHRCVRAAVPVGAPPPPAPAGARFSQKSVWLMWPPPLNLLQVEKAAVVSVASTSTDGQHRRRCPRPPSRPPRHATTLGLSISTNRSRCTFAFYQQHPHRKQPGMGSTSIHTYARAALT